MACPKYDFHIHGKYVGCGGNTLEPVEVARHAAAAGCTAIAITDHVNSVEMLEKHTPVPDDIRAVGTDIDVFFGVEVNFLQPGQPLPFNDELKQQYGVQFAIGGPHHHYLDDYDLTKIIDSQHGMHLEICANPIIDVLVHPYWFGGGSFLPQEWKMFDVDDFRQVPRAYAVELGQAARDSGTAIEINANASLHARIDDDPWSNAYMEYLAILSEQGCTFSPGSDAHSYEALANISVAWEAADRIGAADRIFRPDGEPMNR